VKVEVIQFYYVCGAIVGDSLKAGVPGDQLRFDMIVRNLGNGPDQGVAKIVVGNLGWDVIVTPETFTFPKGQGESGWELTAQFVATIPNHTFVGTYDYTVNVTSIVPSTPVCPLRYHVQVKQVYVPTVKQPLYQTGGPGLQIDFAFSIKNEGNFDDEFSIEVFNLSGWRVFLDPPIGRKLLHSDQDANFTASVIVPNDLLKAQVGQYNQTIRVTSLYAREDIGQTISVELNLTVIILPHIACSVDPPSTDWELNPFAFPNGIGKGNFLLEFSNTGNGGDSLNISSAGPELVNTSLSPTILHLQVLEIKAVLVTMEFPSQLSRGSYDITITGRSQLDTSATCKSVYHVTIVNMNGRLNTVPQGAVQDPEHPEQEIPPPAPFSGSLDQVEGYLVNLRILFENVGDRAISSGTATVSVYDELDCPRAPVHAAHDTCGSRLLTTWTLDHNLITGTTGNTVFVPYLYTAPDWLCFEEAICEANPPVGNVHHIKFVLNLGKESTTADNEATALVNILPARVVTKPAPPPEFPIIPVVAGVLVAGLAGFFVWFNFLRTPKVDEELYASIYGGGQAAEQAAAAAAPKAAGPVNKQTDAQVEEGKRLYGDAYGKGKR
jgi:hypothetical protein